MRHGCALVLMYLRCPILNGVLLLRQSLMHWSYRPLQYSSNPEEETRTIARRTFIVLKALWNFVRLNSFNGIHA